MAVNLHPIGQTFQPKQTMKKRSFIYCGLCGLCGLLAAAGLPAGAAGFPERPIKLVTPFPPGGTVGNIAFVVSTKMGAILGQPLVLDAKPGAAGTIAASFAAKAPKDGYTLLFATSSMLGIAKYIYQDMTRCGVKWRCGKKP